VVGDWKARRLLSLPAVVGICYGGELGEAPQFHFRFRLPINDEEQTCPLKHFL